MKHARARACVCVCVCARAMGGGFEGWAGARFRASVLERPCLRACALAHDPPKSHQDRGMHARRAAARARAHGPPRSACRAGRLPDVWPGPARGRLGRAGPGRDDSDEAGSERLRMRPEMPLRDVTPGRGRKPDRKT